MEDFCVEASDCQDNLACIEQSCTPPSEVGGPCDSYQSTECEDIFSHSRGQKAAILIDGGQGDCAVADCGYDGICGGRNLFALVHSTCCLDSTMHHVLGFGALCSDPSLSARDLGLTCELESEICEGWTP